MIDYAHKYKLKFHMKNIYKNRLLLLADYLDKLPPERFNYNVWVGTDWKGKWDLSCGTKACALGHACTIPELRDAGLRLVREGSNGVSGGIVVLAQHLAKEDFDPSNYHCSETRSVFDLTEDEFELLFVPYDHSGMTWEKRRAPNSDATAQDVADHIRHFVKFKYDMPYEMQS